MSRRFVTHKLTADRLREVLLYEPATGEFTWIRRKGTKRPSAGYINHYGYRVIVVDQQNYHAHRLAWLYVHGTWPACLVDHVDYDKSNNAISNLREASETENQRNNRGLGYSLGHNSKNFEARIVVNKRMIRLGSYATEQEARARYLAAAKTYFGEFAQPDDGGQIAGASHPSATSSPGAQ